MIEWFARNHVAANLLMVGIVVVGAWSMLQRTPLEVFPSIELDSISIDTGYPGSTPEEVEESVTIRIEEAVHDVTGIEEISSRSMENASSITIRLERGRDPRRVLDDLRTRVDGITTFPDDVERPILTQFISRHEVISVVVGGDLNEHELRLLGERVRDDLLALDTLTQVDLEAVRPLEISIEVSERSLREYGLSMEQVASAVRGGSLNVSAGNLRTSGGELLLRTRGQAYSGVDFEQIVVLSRRDGSQLRLGDIARVRDGFDEAPINTLFNGRPGVILEVYRVGQQSAIEVAAAVRDYVDRVQWLPESVEIKYWRDRSKIVKARLSTLLGNGLQGGFLVVLLLTMFLRPSVAFWVSLGIPISFLGCFTILPLLGISINLISLFAFIVVLGIVVDDAIVTGENVYTHMRRGVPPLQAAIDGTREVAVPVTFGVLTTVAAFVPLTMVGGFRGAVWAQIPAVVIPVLIFSLIESKLVLPAHLKYVKPRAPKKRDFWLWRVQQGLADGLEQLVESIYQPILALCIRYRYATLAVFLVALAIAVSLVVGGWMRFIFFPRVQSETARATLVMPAGTPIEVTDGHIQRMTLAAMELRGRYTDNETGESVIRDILSTSGYGARSGRGVSNLGRVVFEMTAPEHRTSTVTSAELVREWRRLIGPIPGAESVNYRAEIGRGGDPINIQFVGNDMQLMAELAELTRVQLASYPDLFDFSDSFSSGKREVELVLRPAAGMLGIQLSDLAMQVRQSFFGYEIQRLQRERDEVKVMLRYPAEQRRSLSNLENMKIRTADGTEVPFAEVARISSARGPSVLHRIDRKRTLNVTADANKDTADIEAIKRDLGDFLDQLVVPYPQIGWSLEGEAKEQRDTLSTIFRGTGAVLCAIYALLAIPFRSYIQPLVVISIIPFGLIGAIVGHLAMGMVLSIVSLLGILALSGVVVNDSLVLVDYINRQREKGVELVEAVNSAGVARFRAIILTSLTTFAGLAPLLFDKSTQAQFLIPMAVSLGFGILFATLITLVLVPANYLIAEDIRQLFRWIYPDRHKQSSKA